MRRQLETLANGTFDVVVVGGGMYGACLAWEATLRGLRVAMIEKADFGWSTSANMHRILHGGFRYLRNADVKRIRESVRERNTMMRWAPHLTGPMPVLVPTYRWGIQNREIMRVAIALYDRLAHDRNRGIEEAGRQIPAGRILSRKDCLDLVPGISPDGITGGAVWYDGRLEDPARLVLEVVRSAADEGASVANYVEATSYIERDGRVQGVRARDVLRGDEFDVRGAIVINARGPWTSQGLRSHGKSLGSAPRYVRTVDAVTRPLTRGGHGLAFMGPKPGRPEETMRYFIAPWREYSVIGSVDYMHDTDPDAFAMGHSELEELVRVTRLAIPGANLTMDDIVAVQAGLIPHDDTEPMNDPYNAARHYQIVDHRAAGGPDGLVSVIGIKYTTARDIAEKTIDLALRKLSRPAVASVSAQRALHYGDVPNVASFLAGTRDQSNAGVEAAIVRELATLYGPKYSDVLALVAADPALAEAIPRARVLRAQVEHAVRVEMACKLSDVVVRRTPLADDGHPGRPALEACAGIMARLLGWDDAHRARELAETEQYLARFWARTPRAA